MDEEDGGGPEMPHGTRMNQTRKRGWGGGDMEMEHQQEATRKEKRKNVAAVRVEQFQNTVVGEGYQAKHVIRQPSKNKEAAKIVDMTGGEHSMTIPKSPNLRLVSTEAIISKAKDYGISEERLNRF
jgi:hypothetical protein